MKKIAIIIPSRERSHKIKKLHSLWFNTLDEKISTDCIIALDEDNECTYERLPNFIYEIVKFANEYNQLIEYCNNQLITISYTLGMSVSTIIYEDYSYNSKSNKFTLNEYNKIKNGAGAGPGLGLGAGVEKKENNEEASCIYINNK